MNSYLCCVLDGKAFCHSCNETWCVDHFKEALQSHPQLGLSLNHSCPSGNKVSIQTMYRNSKYEYELKRVYTSKLCCVLSTKVHCESCGWVTCGQHKGEPAIEAWFIHRKESPTCPEIVKMTPGYMHLIFHHS